MTTAVHEDHETKARPKEFTVNIEGVDYEWDRETITVPEIRTLGGLPADQPVLEINLHDNTERTLGETEVVQVKPGHGFSKKIRYKRG